MNKVLIIDPGKGWGHFVSKMYCYQKLADSLNSKIVFFTKKSTQAEQYLKLNSFCDEVIYLEDTKRGIKNILYNIKSFFKNVKTIKRFRFKKCFVFHPSLRFLLIAKFSKIDEIWGLGLKFQNFLLNKKYKFYSNFFSKTLQNDTETLEFVKKITNSATIQFKPLYSFDYKLRDTVGIIIAASGDEKRWSIEGYIELIDFLIKKKYKKFLIISGTDQSNEENLIKNKFKNEIEIILTSDKKIKDVIPNLKLCKFCIGNDTGFAHLSVNLDIETFIIYGDCPPQSYTNLINHIDIDKNVVRSSSSIKTIKLDKVLIKLSSFLNKKEKL